MSENPQGRKWLVTVNNPQDHDLPRETIIERVMLCNPSYFCMADELGGVQKTMHTHIFIYSESPIRFRTLQSRFNNVAHLDRALGSCQQNRDYVTKQGKWADTLKAETQIEGTFYEWGEMPKDEIGVERNAELIKDFRAGKSVEDIVVERPELAFKVRDLESLERVIPAQNHEHVFRDVRTIYIYGETGTGKTSGIYRDHQGEGICRITNYPDQGVRFDQYKGERVLVFEEFHSQIPIGDMLNFLDIYPLYLPARYHDRLAMYEIVYITSNVPLEQQYRFVQRDRYEVWKAFRRRITEVRKYPDYFEEDERYAGTGFYEEEDESKFED